MGKKTGKNPTDRGKLGVKRSALIDGRGVPLAVAVEGANVPDQKLVAETLDAIPVQRPEAHCSRAATSLPRQRLCRRARSNARFASAATSRTSRAKVNEPPKPKHRRGKARRWKVERTHSWLNRARRLLIRWEKKVANYLGFLHLQFAIVALRTAGVLG